MKINTPCPNMEGLSCCCIFCVCTILSLPSINDVFQLPALQYVQGAWSHWLKIQHTSNRPVHNHTVLQPPQRELRSYEQAWVRVPATRANANSRGCPLPFLHV